jgi:hypothetical protein
MEFSSTTTDTFPTAGLSPIVTTSIAPADFMAAAFTVTQGEDSPVDSMDSPVHTPKLEPIPAPSAVSIMEEPREAFPLAANRASVEVPTEEAAFMGAEATAAVGTANSVQ